MTGDDGTVKRQQPAAIVREPESVAGQQVAGSSSVELLQEVIGRAKVDRDDFAAAARAFRDGGSPKEAETWDAAARDLSLAITHLEDARTRINAARYRADGKFSVSDAARG